MHKRRPNQAFELNTIIPIIPGTLGAHALALLKQLAEFAVSRGSFCSPDSRAPLTAPMQVSLWVQRWQHRLSTWLHVTLSQQLLRMYHPDGALSAVLS